MKAATYAINQVSEFTSREFMPGHHQVFVLVNNDHRVIANLLEKTGQFFLMDGPFIVAGSKIENVGLGRFEELAKEVINGYIETK